MTTPALSAHEATPDTSALFAQLVELAQARAASPAHVVRKELCWLLSKDWHPLAPGKTLAEVAKAEGWKTLADQRFFEWKRLDGGALAPWWAVLRLADFLGLVVVLSGSGAYLASPPPGATEDP